MNIAIILSAGSGSRLKSDVPKQFLSLKGKPVLSISLDKLNKTSFIDGIIVVSHPDHMDRVAEISKDHRKVIAVVPGGLRRQDSVFNALTWIKNNSECSKVWVHDSARPLFSEELVTRLHERSLTEQAVIPAIPSDDTLKRAEKGYVVETLDRSSIYRVQTPQIFDFDVLYKAYLKFSINTDATDDAFFMELFGVKISIVEGEASNIKLTYPLDIKIVELLMNASNKL